MAIRVLVPIAVGATIYLVWRTPTILLFDWINVAGFHQPLMRLRAWMHPFRTGLPNVIVFSLPNALWVYAVTAFNVEVWRRQPTSVSKIAWCGIGPLLALAAEIGQWMALVPGTFDIIDLVTIVIATLTAVVPMALPSYYEEATS